MVRQFQGFLAAVAVLLMVAGFARADDRAELIAGLEAVRAQNWPQAQTAMSRIHDPVMRDVVEWSLLRARQGDFARAFAFLDRRGDWPGLPLLRKRQEGLIPEVAAPLEVIRFFASQAPQTGTGALRLSAAFAAIDEAPRARATLIKAWRNLPLTEQEHALYLARYGALLSPHHTARMEEMLWAGRGANVNRMLPLVDESYGALAKARLGLRAEAAGVDALIEAVPSWYRNDAGLAFERFRWRLAKGREAGALEILQRVSVSRSTLGRPENWVPYRLRLARQLMREGRDAQAYEIAARHYVQDRAARAQLEWLAGYIALRKLGKAGPAIEHFTRFEQAVATPISKGRAGYWLGRAYEAAGNPSAANQAYRRGGAYQTSFYGQLAAEKAGMAMDSHLTGGEVFKDWQQAGFAQSSTLRAGLLLHAAGENWLAERFLTHLAESLSRHEIGQLIDIALLIDDPHIAVMLGKRAASMGYELHKGYYAVMPGLEGISFGVAPEMLLAIARRESEFDPSVVSHAGARGLVQLMPATAQEMAEATGESYDANRLLTDPLYNGRLGVAYLAELQTRFGLSPVLVPAAYNAGPSRAIRWREQLGNPSASNVDVIDWIEHVPFTETRNYIMRVSESLAIYRARLSGRTEPLRLSAELKR